MPWVLLGKCLCAPFWSVIVGASIIWAALGFGVASIIWAALGVASIIWAALGLGVASITLAALGFGVASRLGATYSSLRLEAKSTQLRPHGLDSAAAFAFA